MKALHVCLMAFITFFWIWSMPLLFIGAVCMVPMAVTTLTICCIVTLYLQLFDDGHIKVDHWLRTFMSSIPWHEWFPCNQLSFESGVVAIHPHGVLCCGALAGVHFVPGSKTCMCIAPIVFYVPIIGWVARQLGCIPANKEQMMKALELGYPLVVVPGGVPEIVLAELGNDRKRFKRHGFLRIAQQANVPIHVVFVKGECSTFRMFRGPYNAARVWLSWCLNIPCVFPILLGWYGTWLPKRVPLLLSTLTIVSPQKNTYSQALSDLYKK